MTKSNKEKMAGQIVDNAIDSIGKNAQKEAEKYTSGSKFKKFLKNTKKKIFSKATPLILAGVMTFYGVNKASAESFLDKIDVGVSAGVEYNFGNPISGFYNQLNQDFKDGKYTFTDKVPDWQDITAGNSFVMPEVKGSVALKVADGFKVKLNGGYKFGNGKSDYTQSYNVASHDFLGQPVNVPTNFTRNETFNVIAPTVGLEAILNLSNDTTISVGGNVDFISASGHFDQTMTTPNTGYIQNRYADYSGKNTIFSIEGKAKQKIIEGVYINVAGGLKLGKVECTGTHMAKDNNMNPNWKVSIIPYNPSLDFNSSYIKGGIEVKF